MNEPLSALAAAQDEIARLGRYTDRLLDRVARARLLHAAAVEEMKALRTKLATLSVDGEGKA